MTRRPTIYIVVCRSGLDHDSAATTFSFNLQNCLKEWRSKDSHLGLLFFFIDHSFDNLVAAPHHNARAET